MNILPVALLASTLVLLWVSTREMRLRARLAALAAATILLAASVFENARASNSTGLFSIMARHPDVVAHAFTQNWRAVGDVVAPAIDVLIALAALLCIGCFIALTPGDRVERIIRPVNAALLGAIIGGAVVLVISAVGFGPVSKRQVFIAHVDAADVIDGDTIRMGDVGLRLSGIDAPEDHQICLRPDGSPFDCGRTAAEELRKLAAPGTLFCRAPASGSGPGSGADAEQLRESFGRPLVACGGDHPERGALPDIGHEMVRRGFAYPYQSPEGVMDSPYANAFAAAKAARAGLHAGEFLSPTRWRNDPHERCHLIAARREPVESDPAELARLGKQLERLRKACGLPA